MIRWLKVTVSKANRNVFFGFVGSTVWRREKRWVRRRAWEVCLRSYEGDGRCGRGPAMGWEMWSYLRFWCLVLLFLCLLSCSLPDVALPPPRIVLFGVLAQVLLVPPSGYRYFRRRPGCLASVRGVLWRIVSPVHGNKGLGSVWGSFPLHHASCVVGVLCAPSLRYSSSYNPWPLFGRPLRHGRTPSSACVSVLSLSFATS